MGELTFDDAFNPLIHIVHSSLVCGLTASNRQYGKCWLPRTKTKPHGDWLLYTDSQCACSAHRTLLFHLLINARLLKNLPLFAFETLDSGWSPMRKAWFLTRCRHAWSSHFPSPVLGHSFRIGGTTHLLLLGVDPFIVMVQGRWSSNSFLAYWRNCEEIVPLFISFSLDSHSSILMTMSRFKDHLLNRN